MRNLHLQPLIGLFTDNKWKQSNCCHSHHQRALEITKIYENREEKGEVLNVLCCTMCCWCDAWKWQRWQDAIFWRWKKCLLSFLLFRGVKEMEGSDLSRDILTLYRINEETLFHILGKGIRIASKCEKLAITSDINNHLYLKWKLSAHREYFIAKKKWTVFWLKGTHSYYNMSRCKYPYHFEEFATIKCKIEKQC